MRATGEIMLTTTRAETAATAGIAGGIIGLVDSEAWIDHWQSMRKDTLTNRQRNRIAVAALDEAARAIFTHLDRETSVRWDQLNEIADTNWPDAAKAVALLVWADLCQPGPTRIRLTETGVSILDESSDESFGSQNA